MCQKSYSKFLPSDFFLLPPVWCIFCPGPASGAHVSCGDLQKPHVSILDRLRELALFCHLSASAGSRAPFAWSATPLSFTW